MSRHFHLFQIVLLNYITLAQVELFNKFNSAKQNSPVVVKKATGCSLWRVFCSADGIYGKNETLAAFIYTQKIIFLIFQANNFEI